MKSKSILFLLVLLFSLPAMGQKATSKTSWDYPIKPGTEQWNALDNLNAKLSATQIPESVLKSVSTEELVELCANYPLLLNCFAYNSLDEGVKQVAQQFNGLQELFERPDNAKCLFALIKRLSETESTAVFSEEVRSMIKFNLCILETCLAQNQLLENADERLSLDIAQFAFQAMIASLKNVESEGRMKLQTSAFLLGTNLNERNIDITKSTSLKQFLETGKMSDSSVIDELATLYYQKL